MEMVKLGSIFQQTTVSTSASRKCWLHFIATVPFADDENCSLLESIKRIVDDKRAPMNF